MKSSVSIFCLAILVFYFSISNIFGFNLSKLLPSQYENLSFLLSTSDKLSAAGTEVLPTTIKKHFLQPQTKVPTDFFIHTVNNAEELLKAVSEANNRNGRTAIFLDEGIYKVKSSIRVMADNIFFISLSGNPYNTVIRGLGNKRTKGVQNIFSVRASGFVLDGITLTDTPNHLIQVAGENQANQPIIRNCILQDSFEQMLKVSYDYQNRPQNISVGGIVEHCVFQYTKGIAGNYYTGGIDALGSKNWLVRHNVFKDIASPGKHIAQHAVHFWINSSNNSVINNIFIDNDRAIGFGMKQNKEFEKYFDYNSKDGLIEGNLIYHSDNGDPYADTGIILEASPGTQVKHNYIYMQHSYPRAIEYRFKETTEAIIEGNKTNKKIRSRNGGDASLTDNSEDLDLHTFLVRLESALHSHGVVSLSQPVTQGTSQ